jgi:hypothetical protein
MTHDLRHLLAAACLGLALGGCSEPEPESPLGRGERIYLERENAAERARERGRGDAAVGLPSGGSPAGMTAVKRQLIADYGPYLTPFQRSALLSSSVGSYAEGEAKCKKWIEENRAFDRPR